MEQENTNWQSERDAEIASIGQEVECKVEWNETRAPAEYLKFMDFEYRNKTPADVSTRELLLLLDIARKSGDYCRNLRVPGSALRAELATRDHIPNKNESRMLRKLMSQNKMSETEVRSTLKFQSQLASAAKGSL